MSEFERSGHWRDLPDGTRTWISGHTVIRDKALLTKNYAAQAFKALKVVRKKKVKVRRQAKPSAQMQQTTEEQEAAREARKTAKAKRASKVSRQRKSTTAAAEKWEKDLLRRIAMDIVREANAEATKKNDN